MSEQERDNIIKQGVQIRRNTYRGKDITEYLEDGRLFEMISSGKFDDIYVGDYIVSKHQDTSKKNIVWLIADLDNYLGSGLQKHHATIIPAYKLQDSRMNSTDTTAGGYKGSEMYKSTLNSVLTTYITPDFSTHVLDYSNIVSSAIKDTLSNMYGNNLGASSDWVTETRKLDLMSEVNVYGTTIWSSSGFDIGMDNQQYAIFQLRPELKNQDLNNNSYSYWLKAVLDLRLFAVCSSNSSGGYASLSYGVRPRFLID